MYGYTRTYRAHFAALAGVCFALFSVSSVAVTIDLGPSDYRSWGNSGYSHQGGGVNGRYGHTVRIPPVNSNLNITRNAVVPYGSIANGARNFLRINPASIAASAAITGLFLAVDWVFDQDSGQWMKEGELVPIDPSLAFYHWSPAGALDLTYSTPEDACLSAVDMWNQANAPRYHGTFEFVDFTSATQGLCMGRRSFDDRPPGALISNGSIRRQGNGCPPGSNWYPEGRYCALPSSLIPLNESDWSQLESSLPSASANDVGQAGTDIQRQIGAPLPGYTDAPITGPESLAGSPVTTTTTNPSTGLTTVTEEQTVTRFAYSPDAITVSSTTTTTSYNPDGSLESETVTETGPGESVITDPGTASADWPGFCDWATVVCDWFDWTQDGWDSEEPDLPQIIDFDSSGDYQVGGSGECPAPYNINLGWMLNTTLEVSYQPFCDFAGLVKPLFLAFCYLFAGVITVRSL